MIFPIVHSRDYTHLLFCFSLTTYRSFYLKKEKFVDMHSLSLSTEPADWSPRAADGARLVTEKHGVSFSRISAA